MHRGLHWGPSEAPSIKSPHKPRQEGQRGRQTQREGTGRQISGTRRVAKVKGRKKKELATKEDTMGASEDVVKTPTGGSRSARRRDVEFMVRILPKLEALMGNVEELMLATVEQQLVIAGQEHEEAPCPAIVGMMMHGQEEYAKVLVGGEVYTREQARAAFDSIQWIAGTRKTKADSEERSLQ